MSKKYRKCAMGCPGPMDVVHSFPSDPKRYDDWVRILGIKPSLKKPHICGRHFSPENFYGKKLSKFALPNKRTEDSESITSSNNSNINENSSSSDMQEHFECSDKTTENQIPSFSELQENYNLECNATGDKEMEVLVAEGLQNSNISDSNSQISDLKRALDYCVKKLSEEKKQNIILRKENTKLSQELNKYKKLSTNLGSESCELKNHILGEVVKFLKENNKNETGDKKSIYMIRNSGKYCDVNLINM